MGFDKSSLANAPDDGNSNPGMGALRASLIGELWYQDYASIGTSDTNAAAFQIAIWKIINETTPGDMTDVTKGSFTVSGPQATLMQANAWLSGIALDGSGPQAGGLIALTNPTYQVRLVQTPGAPRLGPRRQRGRNSLPRVGLAAQEAVFRRLPRIGPLKTLRSGSVPEGRGFPPFWNDSQCLGCVGVVAAWAMLLAPPLASPGRLG